MSRRRQQRRAEKERRHLQPPWPTDEPAIANPPQEIIREARYVERLAYTRSQAAQALGISLSTLRRLLPYVETLEMPWGAKLIPVDELERLLAERRQAAWARPETATRGRPPLVSPEAVERIRAGRATGKSFSEIARELNDAGTPTAHGGERWWPSTVRSVVRRAVESQ